MEPIYFVGFFLDQRAKVFRKEFVLFLIPSQLIHFLSCFLCAYLESNGLYVSIKLISEQLIFRERDSLSYK